MEKRVSNQRVIMANLSLAWTGDYNSLKSLVKDELKLDGIWEQPGGYKKVFTSSDFTSISWLKDKKILTIVGKDSEELKQKLFSMLIWEDTAALNSEQAGVNMREPNHHCQVTHESQCPDYSLDIESLHSGQLTHGQAIQTLGESINNVNEMLSELKDLVHQNIKPKIVESNVESVRVTTDECIAEANMHIIRRNSPTRVNNCTIIIDDDRGAEVDLPSIVNCRKSEESCDVDRLTEDNRNNRSVANDSLVCKSTQPVSEINTGAEKNNTIKHELAKQLNDYRNKQRDSYWQMNRQRGQGAAVNRQRGQNAAGVNRQRGHNNGANRQHGLNVGMSQNNHKHNNSRRRDRNTQSKRFFFRRTEKSRQLGDENQLFLTSSRNQKTPTINLTKQMNSWREYPRVSRRSPLSTLV